MPYYRDSKVTFVATCASGLENLLADELSSFKGEGITSTPGAVTFEGSLDRAYRACLWSRFATRILMPLAEFSAPDTDSLYQGVSKIEWNEHFSLNKSFAIDCTSKNSLIKDTKYSALRAKDAVVDQFRERLGSRPSIELKSPDLRIHIFLSEGSATVSLDLSGNSLHKRGYRTEGGEAPLKESLAAAIVSLSGWNQNVSQDSLFLDPMCGSGTLLIEAALIYMDIAPGLGKKYYGFLGWNGHDESLWKSLVEEAIVRKERGLARSCPRIVGYDASREAINNAGENVKQAGLKGFVHVERKELAWLLNPQAKTKNRISKQGTIVINPPYGARLGTINMVRYLYRCLGQKIRDNFPGWHIGFFTANAELAEELGMSSLDRFRLYNGPLVCQLYLYDVPNKEGEDLRKSSGYFRPSANGKGDFANRLRKNLKHLGKWAKRESISCFRLYDGDIPEYNVAIDLYEKWVHIQEYAPPKTVDPQKAAVRLKHIVNEVKDVLGAHHNLIFLKKRSRQRGRSQYQKMSGGGKFREISENRCRLLVNFTDYLDTGLFLDHRIIRNMIQEMADSKRFLNLFGYTGSATVNAAVGGAKSSITVDSSPVYLEWARSNLALNGFSDIHHRIVKADCMRWISETRDQFDLIFVDPPTFSNTRQKKRVFDVQRDHVSLIRLAMKRLESGGILIFSTNFRRFKLDYAGLSGLYIEDKSRRTIPVDFERKPHIHQCWRIRHGKN